MCVKVEPRIRVNFKVSSKGKVTPDITLEMNCNDRHEVLREATRLLDEAIIISKERSDVK